MWKFAIHRKEYKWTCSGIYCTVGEVQGHLLHALLGTCSGIYCMHCWGRVVASIALLGTCSGIHCTVGDVQWHLGIALLGTCSHR